MRRATLVLVLAWASALALAAQTPAAIPINPAPLHFTLPRPFQTTLPNGLRVIILENHRLPTVSVQLAVRGAAGFDEPADLPGLADYTAQMMMLGAGGRDAQQVADALAASGANVNVSAGEGNRVADLFASGLSANFDQWFAVARDVLLHPTFPAPEWAKLEQRAEIGLRQQRTFPGFLVHLYLDQAIYGKFPAGVDTATEASLRAMTTAEFADWHRRRWVPQNAILAISGDVRPATLVPELRRWFADWHRTDLTLAPAGSPAPVAGRRIVLVDRPGSVQTALTLGNLGIARSSPDYFAVRVLNEVLGGGVQSRLFTDLREKQGLAYDVASGLDPMEFAGPWTAGGDFRTAVTGQALTSLLAQVQRLSEEPVSEAELKAAKEAIVAGFALGLERPAAAAGEWLESAQYGFPADYWDTFAARVNGVTAADVQRVAKKYYDPATLQIVAVGDAAKIEPLFAKLGAVEVLNADGTPRKAAAPAPAGRIGTWPDLR